MKTKLKSALKSLAKTVTMIIIVLVVVEWWQSRSLFKGKVQNVFAKEKVPSIDGRLVSFNSKGTMLLYVFAPWCSVCKVSAPNLNDLDRQSLEVVALALSWKDRGDILEFVNSSGLKVPTVVGSDQQGITLGVQAFPTYFLIRDGRIVKAWAGYTTSLGITLRSWWVGIG